MRRQLLAGAAAACALLAAGSACAQAYGRLVVFGDSLSDNGNLFRVTGGRPPAPPSPPYFQGRFSNGPVFTELLGFANTVERRVACANNLADPSCNQNFAFGGARTDLSTSPPGIRLQLQSYLAGGGRFTPTDLVSVYGGANNIFQGIGAAAVSPSPTAAITGLTNAAAADIGLVINSVARAGAGTILVPNLPSLGATPQFNGFVAANAPAGPLAEFATGTLNAALLAQANAAAAANPGTNFIYMDVNRFNAFVLANPGAFGFTNTITPCLNPTTGAVCANPDQFLFWDNVHPTAAGHRGLAALALEYLFYGSIGAATAALGETSLEHRESATGAALDRLEEDREGDGPRFSLALDGGRGTVDARGSVPGIERDTAAVRVSVDTLLRPDFTVGAQFSAAHSEAQVGALEFQTDSLGFDAYLGFTRGAVFVNLVGGGSSDEYTDYRRRTGAGRVIHFADRVTGSSLGGKIQTGLRLPFGQAELSPRVAVSAKRVEVEAFSENGPAARHAIRRHDIEAAAAEAALRLESPLGGGRFRAHLEGGYGDFFDYDGAVAVALADNPARPIETEVDAPGRGALLKAGVEGQVFGGLQLGLAYHGRFDGGSDNHAARLSLTYRPGS